MAAVNLETMAMHSENGLLRGVGFYNGADYGLQLCLACEYVTFTTWGLYNKFSLKGSI